MARRLSNWLLGYKEYTRESESPEPFHMWTALSIMSAATRRNIYLDQGYFTVYPNLYVILVSPPGTCRKSAAMNIGKGILDHIPGVNVEANKMSPQALINSLSGGTMVATPTKPSAQSKATLPTVQIKNQCTSLLFSTEFSVMLGPDAHQNGMLSLLTDLYDCPSYWKYETLSRGQEILNNVYLGILGATTPDWLSSSIPPDAIGGGFTSRILFVAQHARRHDNPRPRVTPAMLKLKDELIQDLIHISKLSGEMKLSPEAELYYDHWYRNLNNIKTLDERFWGYLERKPIHLLKIAMLIALSFGDSNIITEEYLGMGLSVMAKLEERMPDAFRGVGSPTARDLSRVVDQITNAGGLIDFKDLMALNTRHINYQELETIVRTMVVADMVKEINSNGVRILQLNAPPSSKKGEVGAGGGANVRGDVPQTTK